MKKYTAACAALAMFGSLSLFSTSAFACLGDDPYCINEPFCICVIGYETVDDGEGDKSDKKVEKTEDFVTEFFRSIFEGFSR